MQKFPLRMKDNDLLVTELYRDPNNDAVTAISVYLTPKTSKYTCLTILSVQLFCATCGLKYTIMFFTF